MSTETSESSIIKYDGSIKQDSPDPASEIDRANELASITEIQSYLQKYSTTSSVFAEQSISNPDYQRTLYCISCILQAELFDDLKDAKRGAQANPELLIMTSLPPHLGGPVEAVADELLDRETMDDPELRAEIIAGTVPTVDTILRFISWLHQSAKYSAQCNIIAFIYIKRMMDAKCILTMENWRGMWLGSIILAQKIWDDASLRTSSFASILPGVSKTELKGLEFKIFTLLNYCTTVKPSVFARFYFELREIFKSITGEFRDASVRGPRRRPLTMKNGMVLNQCVDELSGPTKSTSRRGSSCGSSTAAAGTSTEASSLPPSISPSKASQDRDSSCSSSVSKTSQQQHGAQKLPVIKSSPYLSSSRSFRAVDDGAGTSGRDGEQHDDNSMLCSHPLASAPPTPGGARGHHHAGSSISSSSKSSSRAPRFTFKPSKPSPKTLEDFDYVNPSIFVLS